MDCGPTCLRMVSAYYGKRYSLEKLREKSFITREGVSMLGISEAAEKLGFRSICVQVDYTSSWKLPCPASYIGINSTLLRSTNNNQQVWVADPGAGKTEIYQRRILPLLDKFAKERGRYGSSHYC